MTTQKQDISGIAMPFFKGIGQIMLQENFLTGLLFLAGIFCGSWMMGLAATIAVITGTGTALLLKYDKEEINSGLYGFSAALVGVALLCFFQPSVLIWVAVIVGAALAAVIQHFYIVRKIPGYTFPFILVTWLFLGIVYYYPTLVVPQSATNTIYEDTYVSLFAHGFGQVIFQDNIWAGLLFIVGVFINRPVAAMYGLLSIAISSVLAYLLNQPLHDIYLGLLSYNAVLCAITFSGKKAGDFLMALIAVVLSVLIMIQMRNMGLPALTFPFVLATWIVLILKKAMKKD